MIIAVDIDNTLFTCNSIVYKVFNKIQKVGKPEAKKLTYKTVAPNGKISQSFLRLFVPMLNAKKFEALDGALETLEEWKKQGHEIVLLTNRPGKIKIMRNATLALLKYHNVTYDKLVMGCKNKHLFCKEFGISLLIDDNKQNCENANYKGITSVRIGKENMGNDPQGITFNVNNWKTAKLYVDIIRYNKMVRVPHNFENVEETRRKLMLKVISQKGSNYNYDQIIPSDYNLKNDFMLAVQNHFGQPIKNIVDNKNLQQIVKNPISNAKNTSNTEKELVK